MASVRLVLFFIVASSVSNDNKVVLGQTTPVFDGIIRPTSDGREEAYLTPPFGSNHASHIELIPGMTKGTVDMLVAWFSGSREGAANVSIVISRLVAGSRQWPNATVVSVRDGYSNQNPVLFFHNTTTDPKIFLFHSQQQAGAGESHSQIWALESTPDGKNWTTPKSLFTAPGSFPKNRMILSLNGTGLLPIYYSVTGFKDNRSSVKEWLGGNALNNNTWVEHGLNGSSFLIQPTIFRSKAGSPRLIAFFRDSTSLFIYRAISEDDGKTWSAPSRTTLPNNNSGIQACTLMSGNIAMVYNPTRSGRNPLSISLSEDEGLTWKYTRILTSSVNSSEFSYPSIIQDIRDGAIYITHTYARSTIKYYRIPNEDWIKMQ